jgi:hypothetical protein
LPANAHTSPRQGAFFIRNEASSNLLTEMPSPLFFSALCVVRGEDCDEAIRNSPETNRAPADS